MLQLNNIWAVFRGEEDNTYAAEGMLFLDEDQDVLVLNTLGGLDPVVGVSNFVGFMHSSKEPNKIDVGDFARSIINQTQGENNAKI